MVTQALPFFNSYGATPNSTNVNQQVTLIAQLFGSDAGAVPTGTFTFLDGTKSVTGNPNSLAIRRCAYTNAAGHSSRPTSGPPRVRCPDQSPPRSILASCRWHLSLLALRSHRLRRWRREWWHHRSASNCRNSGWSLHRHHNRNFGCHHAHRDDDVDSKFRKR
jgi:hypothetical protein